MDKSGMDDECLRSIQESSSLAELVQTILEDCKGLHPAIDDFISKSSKLENQIRSTIFAFSTFIESLQKIAHKASNTKGSSRDIGSSLLKVSMQQKVIETQLRNFSSSFSNWCTVELKRKNDDSKKRIKLLDKHHMKEFKNARNRICTKIDTIDKLRRKVKGTKQQEYQYENAEIERKISCNMAELVSYYRQLERQERMAVRRVQQEERNQYSQLTSCLRQMLGDQRSLMMDMECAGQVVETLDRTLMDNMVVVGVEEEEDKISACSSLRSLRSVSSSVSSRSQSPLCPADLQARVVRRDRTYHWETESQVQQNRLSYISLPGERQSLEPGERRSRPRPSSTYDMISSSSSRSPHRSVSLCREVSGGGVSSPPSSLQLYTLPDFNLTHRNMVLPLPHCDPGGFQDEEEAEEDLKTPTIENVLSLNEL